MRNRSIVRIILDSISQGFKYLKNEFGVWAYGILVFAVFIFYRPVKNLLDTASYYFWYIFLGAIIVLILYLLLSKLIRSIRR